MEVFFFEDSFPHFLLLSLLKKKPKCNSIRDLLVITSGTGKDENVLGPKGWKSFSREQLLIIRKVNLVWKYVRGQEVLPRIISHIRGDFLGNGEK